MAASERAYSMTNRAAAAAETRNRILRAVLQLATEKLSVEIVLADVAEHSGVTVQTILRHFGTRDALFDQAVSYGASEIVDERATPVGDIPKAVEVIMDHYEARGDWVVALLRQEASDERIRAITEQGKLIHREWVKAVFGPQLAKHAEQELLTDLLVVATDVSCWKLLRRDRGLSRRATERAMRVLVEAILGASLNESE